jgi:hypothetical protein
MVPDDVVLITAAAGGLGALLVHAAGSPPVLLDRPIDPSSLQPGIRPVPLPRWRPPPGTSSAHPATAP